MTTALQIITRALDEIGVGQDSQAVSASDAQKCLRALNVLANAWLTAPNYAYTSSYVTATLDAGVTALSIGPALELDTPRPTRIESAFATVGNVDYPIRMISEAEYLAIPIKDLQGPWPSVMYYDTGSPTGLVYFFPTGACTVTLSVMLQLSQFATLTTDYNLPPGYERAYALTLAEEIGPMFARPANPVTMRNAKSARRDIKRANFVVPQLDADTLQDVTLPIVSNGAYSGVDDA